MDENFQLPDSKLRGIDREEALFEFAGYLKEIQEKIGFKVSSRGWGYLLEQYRLINKDEFDRVEKLINNCRKEGMLPIDFTAEEEGRQFSGVEVPEERSIKEILRAFMHGVQGAEWHLTPDWWGNEEYYIQMVVEKIDLKTLFEPVCQEYHIPIATSKGWASMLMRATYARRFAEAEDRGMTCVLLYCGDHDPDGLRISEFLRNNLADLEYVHWEDGEDGYDPVDLEIKRFGLNRDFIDENELTWINNLITGSGKNLGSPNHKNYRMEYLQQYLRDHGIRKCEANALVVQPESGRAMCRTAIEQYLGADARHRFRIKRHAFNAQFEEFREESGLGDLIDDALEMLKEDEEE